MAETSGMSTNTYGAKYATVMPPLHNSSVPHHHSVESLEDSAKIPGRIAYPLIGNLETPTP